MQKENEVFAPIAGTQGRYEVSNLGNVRSIYKNGRGKVLRQNHGNWGYMTVNLSQKRGIAVRGVKQVHRLVAAHFVRNGDPKAFKEVNHLDGNKLNNCADNLEWCDHKRNMNHAFETGLVKMVGERSFHAKFSNELISKARELHSVGKMKQKDIANKFGIERSHLSRILNNKIRKYG